MATRYWVGGSGFWDDTARWSTTSGGAGGASIPTSADDAIINAASGAGLDVNGFGSCATLTATGATGTFNAQVDVYGAAAAAMLTVPATFVLSGNISFYNTVNKTINVAGTSHDFGINFEQSTGGVTLAAALTCGQVTGGNAGTGKFATANFALTCGTLFAENVNTLTFGSSTVNIGSQMYLGTIGTFTHTGSLSLIADGSPVISELFCSGQTLGSVTLTGFSANTTLTSLSFGGFTCANLYLSVGGLTYGNSCKMRIYPYAALSLTPIPVTVTGVFQATGSSPLYSRLQLRGHVEGLQSSLILTGTGTRLLSYVDFADIAVTYSSNITGTSLGNCANNSGITFDAPRTLYAVGAGTSSWGDSVWSLSSGGSTAGVYPPLPQDSVVIDSNSPDTLRAGTINLCGDIAISASGKSCILGAQPDNALQTTEIGIWGSITGDASYFSSFVAASPLALYKRGSQSLQCTSGTLTLILKYGADVTLSGNCELAVLGSAYGSVSVNSGASLDLDTFGLYCRQLIISSGGSGSGNLGSSVSFVSAVLTQPFTDSTTGNWPNTDFYITCPRTSPIQFPGGASSTQTIKKIVLSNASTGVLTDGPSISFGTARSLIVGELTRTTPNTGPLRLSVVSGRTLTVGVLSTDGQAGKPTIWGTASSGTLAIGATNVNTQYTIFNGQTSSGGTVSAYGPLAVFNSSGNIVQAGTYKCLAFTPSTTSFTVPTDFTGQATVAIVGGGGGGGRSNTARGFSGGGGAANSVSQFIVCSPGQTIYHSIGSGGNGATTLGATGTAGTASWVNTLANSSPTNAAYGARANGAAGGGAVGAAAGSTSGAVGLVTSAGGSTPQPLSGRGGSGGGSSGLFGFAGKVSGSPATGTGSGGGSPYGTGGTGGNGGLDSLGGSALPGTNGTSGGGGGGAVANNSNGGNGAVSPAYAYDLIDGSGPDGTIGPGGAGGGGYTTTTGVSSGGGAGSVGAGGGGSGGYTVGTSGNGGSGGAGLLLFFYSTTSTNRASSSFIG